MRHVLAGDLAQFGLGAALHLLGDLLDDGGAAAQRLEVTAPAAAAFGAARFHGDVADLPRHLPGAAVELAVGHDPAADTSSRPDAKHVPRAAPRSHLMFGEDRDAHVVAKEDRPPETPCQLVAQWKLDPAEVRCDLH